MATPRTLDSLETSVLARIARHREDVGDRASPSAGTLLVFAALTAGLVIGFGRSHQAVAPDRGAESILLADSAQLAPSGLFARTQ